MDQERTKHLTDIKTSLDAIEKIDIDELVGHDALGEFRKRFAELRPDIVQAISFAQKFKLIEPTEIPVDRLSGISSPLRELKESLQGLRQFNATQGEGEFRSLKGKFQGSHNGLFGALEPVWMTHMMNTARFEQMATTARECKDQAEISSRRIGELVIELAAIVEGQRVEAGVEKFAANFIDTAKYYKCRSLWWLISMILLMIATGGYAMWLATESPASATTSYASIVQQTVTRVIVISLGYFGIVFMGRNYRALRHLAVVNRHRGTALSSFQKFYKSAIDPHVKNAVLLEATHCIFAPAVTGFLGVEEENPSARILEITKTMASAAAK